MASIASVLPGLIVLVHVCTYTQSAPMQVHMNIGLTLHSPMAIHGTPVTLATCIVCGRGLCLLNV